MKIFLTLDSLWLATGNINPKLHKGDGVLNEQSSISVFWVALPIFPVPCEIQYNGIDETQGYNKKAARPLCPIHHHPFEYLSQALLYP